MKLNQQTIGISFFVRKSKLKNGQWPIFARITVNKERKDFSIKEWVNAKSWDEKHNRAKNTLPELRQLNTYLESIRSKIMQSYRELQLEGKMVNAETLKRSYFGLDEKAKTLLELMDYHNTQMVGKLAEGTLKNYRSTSRYIQKFLMESKKRSDIFLNELDYRFLLEFEQFVRNTPLKDFDPCHNNGLMKHIERIRKITNLGVRLGWMGRNPFENYRISFQKYDRQFLDKLELDKIEQCILSDSTLLLARDLFIFSCYTGLAPVDLSNLTKNNVINGSNGELWIHTEREKTGTIVNIPLLPKAMEIVQKYNNHPIAIRRNRLFPPLSNQQLNKSLKIIGEICSINKYLTFYISRHTFATTITLNNGVPMETVSKMLGHTKYATTQIYARILNKKIGEDMASLRIRLTENKNN